MIWSSQNCNCIHMCWAAAATISPCFAGLCSSCAVRHVFHANLDGGHVRPLLLALQYRSIAETFCPADFVEMIHNKKGEREGWTVYGFTKMANIWMAKVPAACSSAALACAYSRQHGHVTVFNADAFSLGVGM